MSDNEDYMSDKLLDECSKIDVRPGLLFNRSQKRTHEIYKKKSDDQNKRPKTYTEQEKEQREKGLSTALPTSNVGFKMLQKMGFKEGSGIGRTKEGIKEPISIVVKSNQTGVGREKHIEESVTKKQEDCERMLKDREEEFRLAISERNMMYILTRDYTKAQRVCEELDAKSNITYPVVDHFWTRATIKRLMQEKKKQEGTEEDDSGEDNEDELVEDSEDDVPPEEITTEKLNQIIDYLREKYRYCLYCGFCSDSDEEMAQLCPGPYRVNHDDDDA